MPKTFNRIATRRAIVNADQTNKKESPTSAPEWLEVVREEVRRLRFGTVQITVHEGRVVQVERTEKFRMDKPAQD